MNLRHLQRRRVQRQLGWRNRAKPYTLVLHMKGAPVGELKQRKRTRHLLGVVPVNPGLPNDPGLITHQLEYDSCLPVNQRGFHLSVDPAGPEGDQASVVLVERLHDNLANAMRVPKEIITGDISTQTSAMQELMQRWIRLLRPPGHIKIKLPKPSLEIKLPIPYGIKP